MAFLVLWVLLTLIVVHLCSLLETTLFSVRVSTLLARKAGGSAGAARLLQIKQERIDEAIGAVLVLNTLATSLGLTLVGARAATFFAQSSVALLSTGLTVVLLVVSEIIPKTLAARYAGSLSGFVGYAFSFLIPVMSPVLAMTNALIRLLARRPRERLTRREFTMFVGTAHKQGTISLAESMAIGSLIYSREVTVQDVMTPASAIFAMSAEQTVGDLLAAPGADAFSRIPLFEGIREHIIGYVSHREVLKAFAMNGDRTGALRSFLPPIPFLEETVQVGKATGQILRQREAIAIVTGNAANAVGLVTLEDLFEAILGTDITDEAEAIASLRPAVTAARKRRLDRLRRRRQRDGPQSD
jgi:CBS domain containing-hemolysin-like protein